MKQRAQIISESLYEIQTAVNRVREIACDLTYCGISTYQLTRAINAIEKYRVAVAVMEKRLKLSGPHPLASEDHAERAAGWDATP
jgi:hypothetical protein